ncbi:MAG TPA: hypothetical protein VIJ20_03835 [Solirubrobacteraceae bacterium]
MSTESVATPRGGANPRWGEGRLGGARELLRRHHAEAALLLYMSVAVVYQYHAVVHLSTSCACLGDDPTQFMWSMVWWPHAILNGLNPFVTHLIWVPGPINVAANTSVPGPALLAAPLTALAGPVVSYNVLMIIAPVTGAWFAYRLCLYLTRSPAASILAGFLFGFSAYGLGELEGHMQLVFTFAAPAAALLTLKRLDGVITARRYLVLMALVLIAQLSCGTEMTFTLTVMGVVALAAGWVFSSPDKRRRILALLAPLAGAFAVTAIVCSPFLYYALTGPAVAANRGLNFPADLLSFAVPTVLERIGGHRFTPVSNGFQAGYIETGTYVGLPVIIMVAAFIVQRWRTRTAKILCSILTVVVVWSLGERLNIDGHATIPLPWKLVGNLPVLNEILPVRNGVYVFLACAVCVALWLATPGSSRLRRWLLAAVAVAFLIPNTALFDSQIDEPAFFTTSLYRHYLSRNEIVLPIPYGTAGPALLWQASAHMYFRMASGNFYLPADYGVEPFVQQAITPPYAPPPSQAAVAALRAFIAQRHVSAIIVKADQTEGWPRIIARLGVTSVDVGGVLLYRVNPAE